MPYYLAIAGHGTVSSGQLQSQLAELHDRADRETADQAFRHIMEIERIVCRGLKYSNQDFDVLSAAQDFIERIPA